MSPLALIVKGSGNEGGQESTDLRSAGEEKRKSVSSTIPAWCIMGNAG